MIELATPTVSAPPPWCLACPDWEDKIRKGESLIPPLPLFESEAVRALKAFNMMRIPDTPDRRLMGDAVGQWFKEIVAALFGSYDPILKKRMIQEIFALVPKKSGKTTLSAALMLVALLLNMRRRVEFLLIGPTHAVAEVAFAQAVGIIEADEILRKILKPRDHKKEIVNLRTQARLKIKSFDMKIVTGTKPAGILLDELWVMGKDAKAESIIRQLRGGLISNPEAFMVIITTQSDFEPTGVFKTELIKARQIRDGKIEGTMLPVLYEFPPAIMESDEWRNPENWKMVTPSLGNVFTLDRLINDYHEARNKSEAELKGWASQHLNLEIGISLGSGAWAGAKHWEKNAAPLMGLKEILDACEVVTAGIDGGGLDDLLGLTIIGRHKVTKVWMSWSRAWVHRSVLELRQEIAPKLLDLEKAGELVIVDDDSNADVTELCDILERVEATGLLAENIAIGVDPYGIGAIVDELVSRGIDTSRIANVPQGFKLMTAIKASELKLARGEIIHADQRLMDWCVGNAKVELRGNAVLITKQQSGVAKIDPLMAFYNAVYVMAGDPTAAGATGNPVADVH